MAKLPGEKILSSGSARMVLNEAQIIMAKIGTADGAAQAPRQVTSCSIVNISSRRWILGNFPYLPVA